MVAGEAKKDAKPHRDYAETVPGTAFKLEMIAIPGGEFTMGSRQREKKLSKEDEAPPHRVRIQPLWMSKVEIPWDLYDLFASRDKGKAKKLGLKPDLVTRPSPAYVDPHMGYGDDGFPALGISHHAAMEFCRWLSAQTGKEYRLPTEAEWEYAARAGTTTAFFFGDDPADLGDYAWYEKNSGDVTHPVGKKKPNPWGLCDMYGNVAEWCLDLYDAKFYQRHPEDKTILNPLNPPTTARYPNVARGGSFLERQERCRSAARLASDMSWNKRDPGRPQSIWWLADADFVGFRVVRAVEEQEHLNGVHSKVTPESR